MPATAAARGGRDAARGAGAVRMRSTRTIWLARRQRAKRSAEGRSSCASSADSQSYQRPIEDMFVAVRGPHGRTRSAAKSEVGALYGRGDLELLDYRLAQDPLGQFGLDFSARRNSWGPNYLRFGVALQDDFKGRPSSMLRDAWTSPSSIRSGAESVWDVQVGTAPLLATELYLPLSNVTRYFVAPHAQVEAHDVAQVVNDRQVGEYRVSSVDYGLDFGREFSNWGEMRVGALNSRGSSRVRPRRQCSGLEFQRRPKYFARFGFDTLDSREFSSHRPGADGAGQLRRQRRRRAGHRPVHARLARGPLLGQKHRGRLGHCRQYYRRQRDQRAHLLSARRLPEPVGRAGRNAGRTPICDRAADLSAQGRQRRRGHSGRAGLRRHFVRGRKRLEQPRHEISFGSTRKDFSVFFGADTYIGPAYLAVGYDETGSTAFYLFLGRSF